MKRTSPMKMAQPKRASATTTGTNMAAYAKKRNSTAAKKDKVKSENSAMVPLASQMGREVPHYDPQYDLDTLTRASEIHSDRKRHSQAMGVAKKKHATLQNIMGSKRGA